MRLALDILLFIAEQVPRFLDGALLKRPSPSTRVCLKTSYEVFFSWMLGNTIDGLTGFMMSLGMFVHENIRRSF